MFFSNFLNNNIFPSSSDFLIKFRFEIGPLGENKPACRLELDPHLFRRFSRGIRTLSKNNFALSTPFKPILCPISSTRTWGITCRFSSRMRTKNPWIPWFSLPTLSWKRQTMFFHMFVEFVYYAITIPSLLKYLTNEDKKVPEQRQRCAWRGLHRSWSNTSELMWMECWWQTRRFAVMYQSIELTVIYKRANVLNSTFSALV